MSEVSVELLSTLGQVREALNDSAVDHVFIGALPVMAWGRPRSTTDLDLVVFCEPPAFARLDAALVKRQFKAGKHVGPAEPSDALPDIAVYWLAGVRVDVFVAKMDFERAVRATARQAMVLGSSLLVASCESSLVYKLLAARAKDIADVESMFEAQATRGLPLDWSFLDKWSTEWGIADRLAPYAAKYRK